MGKIQPAGGTWFRKGPGAASGQVWWGARNALATLGALYVSLLAMGEISVAQDPPFAE